MELLLVILFVGLTILASVAPAVVYSLVILVVLLLAWDREKARIVRELRDEIGRGTVSRTDYEIAASYWQRIAAQ